VYAPWCGQKILRRPDEGQAAGIAFYVFCYLLWKRLLVKLFNEDSFHGADTVVFIEDAAFTGKIHSSEVPGMHVLSLSF